jgi:HSP20 family protein
MPLMPLQNREYWQSRFQDIENLHTELSRLLNLPFARRPLQERGLLEGIWSPAIDVYESKENILVIADIPGVTRDDIEVTVEGDTLIIKGAKKLDEKSEEQERIRAERFYGSFNRALTLPGEIDAARVTATYRNGVLELTLPKKEEYTPKQIKIDVK